MKMRINLNILTFAITLALCAAAAATAWSCGQPGGSASVFTKSYGSVCGPKGNCGTSFATDFLTYPEVQSMIRRNRKQRYFYGNLLDEIRNMNPSIPPDGFSPWIQNRRTVATSNMSQPRYDVTENESNFKIEMDVPGIDMSNISIILDEETKILTISGNRVQKQDATSDSNDSQVESKLLRTFTQKFVLKNPLIDSTQITASLENGVLAVTLQKFPIEIKKSNVRTIPIESNTKSNDFDQCTTTEASSDDSTPTPDDYSSETQTEI